MNAVNSLKTIARSAWPAGYEQLAKLKAKFVTKSWDHYFDAANPQFQVPERCAVAVAEMMPPDVDTVLIIGCAPGRDFIPFQNRYKLRGFDIAPFDRIRWVCDTSNLDYWQMTMQEFMKTLNEDLSKTLVYSSGTLMLLNAQEQIKLYEKLKQNGCRTFVFQEKTESSGFILPEDDFRQVNFREGIVTYLRGI